MGGTYASDALSWDVDLDFNLVTHVPSKVSFAVEFSPRHWHADTVNSSDFIALYIGDPLKPGRLGLIRAAALQHYVDALHRHLEIADELITEAVA